MAFKFSGHIEKKWVAKHLQHLGAQKTIAGIQKYQKALLKILENNETNLRSLNTKDITFDQVVEIFGLKLSKTRWELLETYDTPKFLTDSLKMLKKAVDSTRSEAYSRIATHYLIANCMAMHRDVLSRRLTDDLNSTSIAVLEPSELPINSLPIQATELATTILITPKDTFQSLPIKVFLEISLSVYVKKGGRVWEVAGIADWAIGYGYRADLEDGTVLLAIEAKQRDEVFIGESQLLAYLATIRQLRIQAGKKNVMTQGILCDGGNYRFLCIRNNGTVMKSAYYDITFADNLKSVFNFLLGMLNTAAESSPNTSPTKPGLEQDEKIENFDREVFVEVVEDIDVDGISIPTVYYSGIEGDELPDVIPEEE